MNHANKRGIGTHYEEIAANYLKAQGLILLERNFRSRQGEIDLIARDGAYLVFVEVKYRRDERKGAPAEAVGYQKQVHIRKVAAYYLYSHHYAETTACRFDVISVVGTDITWIQNAF